MEVKDYDCAMPDFEKFPRGTSNPHVVRPYPMPWESRPGGVSLVPVAQRPVEVEPLRKVSGSDVIPQGELAGVASPVRAWIREAIRLRLDWEVWHQVVYPVSARSRRSARLQTVYWVRVRIGERRVIVRGWRQPNGLGGWQALETGLWRPWRGRMIPEKKLSAKDAKEMMKAASLERVA